MRRKPIILMLSIVGTFALLTSISTSSPPTAHAGAGDDMDLAARVKNLEQRITTLEKIVESMNSTKATSEVIALLRKERQAIAENLQSKVADYLSAITETPTDAARIQMLGLEVDRHRKLLQLVVEREGQLQGDSGVTKR
jgi:cobalamin biosynthesis protein CbiD